MTGGKLELSNVYKDQAYRLLDFVILCLYDVCKVNDCLLDQFKTYNVQNTSPLWSTAS